MAVAQEHLKQSFPPSPDLRARFLTYIHSEFEGMLRSYLMRSLGNQADADDYVQEVYLRIARQGSLRHIDSARAFVFKTARNLLCDRSRRLVTRLQEASVSCDDVVLSETSLDPAGRIIDEERLRCHLDALGRTSDKAQEAFRMNRLDGMSYNDIAQHMNISVSMVEKHISAVLRALDDVE
jgi:RNA polymerase sigma-70 factor (ECF subfamily)